MLRAGSRLFVGLSRRTDAAGARALAELAAHDRLEVVTVPVAAGLHLKSATCRDRRCTSPGRRRAPSRPAT